MKTSEKIYRAYGSYGHHCLQDAEVLERVSQNRKKWQCKPVHKLYARKSIGKGSHYNRTFLVKALIDTGMTYEEAMKSV